MPFVLFHFETLDRRDPNVGEQTIYTRSVKLQLIREFNFVHFKQDAGK